METVLITGASSGIGLEFAKIFAAANNNLVLVARSGGKLIQLAEELLARHEISVKVIGADLSKMAEVQRVYDTCKAYEIQVDYLINNAGFGDFGFFIESDWYKLEQMIDLNIKALTKMCHLFIPGMVQRKSGKVLNVAAAFKPGPSMAAYYATKSYVLLLTRAIYNELQGTGVNITCLCPGATQSGFQSVANLHESAMIKGKKLPTAKEVAAFGYNAMMKNKLTVSHGRRYSFHSSQSV